MFPKTPGGELAGGGLLALWIVLITGGNCWLLLSLQERQEQPYGF